MFCKLTKFCVGSRGSAAPATVCCHSSLRLVSSIDKFSININIVFVYLQFQADPSQASDQLLIMWVLCKCIEVIHT